jgi:AraC-like DNA-binding protein
MARRLGCTVEGLRLAKEQLTRSPLYGLARRHFLALCEQASDLAPDVMTMIGRSTVELVGAMVVTAADGRDADAYLEQTFLVRLTAYVEANLQDSDLGAAQIAAAHYISVRQLYNVWARDAGGPTLGQSIMSRRLARAHGRLAEGSPARLNISAVARQCGYTNVTTSVAGSAGRTEYHEPSGGLRMESRLADVRSPPLAGNRLSNKPACGWRVSESTPVGNLLRLRVVPA